MIWESVIMSKINRITIEKALQTKNVNEFKDLWQKEFRLFKEARKFAISLGLKSSTEWLTYCKSGNKPNDVPSAPYKAYKSEWQGYGDWLGTGNLRTKDFSSFETTRNLVRSLKLKSREEWRKYIKSGKKPNDIPVAPNSVYKKEWQGWGDFLGTGTIAPQNKKFRSFDEARNFARSLQLKSQTEWNLYCKSGNKPDDIPSNPNETYKSGWISLIDWLGNK